MATTAANTHQTFDSSHDDMLHDAQLDYYGTTLATCSSDTTTKLFKVSNNSHTLITTLQGHSGPVWQVAWSHPKYGNLLATCSYDTKVFVWRDTSGNGSGKWEKIYTHAVHSASVNSISWAPHEYGLHLACASSDGSISILSVSEDGTWSSVSVVAHSIGANAVSWAPSSTPGSLVSSSLGGGNNNNNNNSGNAPMRFVSAGCDNLIKIWSYSGGDNATWVTESTLEGHSDWVRDVAWAPSIGLSTSFIASCSQDKSVLVWVNNGGNNEWAKKELGSFADVVWRVSWSPSGNILAVSSGDNKVGLWKEGEGGAWLQVGDVGDN